MPVEILPSAKKRLLEIWQYTASKWGEPQAHRYTRDLIAAIQGVASQPTLWRKYPRKKIEAVFFIQHAHHYIFFRQLGNEVIGVMTILHESMDIPTRLKEDDVSLD